MRGDLIPSSDHLALHCPPRAFAGVEIDPTGVPVGITREAFQVDDDGISTNWIEFNGGNLASACMMLACVLTVRRTHRVGVMNVGAAIDLGQATNRLLQAVHDPIEPPDTRPNPGHALLQGVAAGDDELLDFLAMLVQLKAFTPEAIAQSKALFG